MALITPPPQDSKQEGNSKARQFMLTKKDLLAVTEHAPDVICRFDNEFRLLYVNPAIERATGYPVEAFVNKTTRELGMPEEHSASWEENISYAMNTHEKTIFEFPFLTPTGIRFFQALVVPEMSEDGSVKTVLTISRDITEKKELDKKREAAVGYISHELKTPVTSLKMTTDYLTKKFIKAGDFDTAERISGMSKQIDKMTNIISDLLDTTHIDRGSMRLKIDSFHIEDLVKEVVKEVQSTTKYHKIKIEGTVKEKILADRTRIGQVITNFLTNAIRYSGKEKKIIIKVSSDDKNMYCSVQDFGIGISEEEQEKIFDKFYRVSDVERSHHMGLGLGLFICNEIIHRHKGKIWVNSVQGEGSTFYFSLPKNHIKGS